MWRMLLLQVDSDIYWLADKTSSKYTWKTMFVATLTWFLPSSKHTLLRHTFSYLASKLALWQTCALANVVYGG